MFIGWQGRASGSAKSMVFNSTPAAADPQQLTKCPTMAVIRPTYSLGLQVAEGLVVGLERNEKKNQEISHLFQSPTQTIIGWVLRKQFYI